MSSSVVVLAALEKLKLSAMAAAWERQEANRDRRGASARMADLLLAELENRNTQAVDRRRNKARLEQPSADLRDFDCQPGRNLSQEALKVLGGLPWLKSGTHLVFTGGVGVGKSWLACALANKAIGRGHSVQSWAVPDLLAEWRREGDAAYLLRSRLAKLELLILEDWGMERLHPDDAEILRRILQDRIDARSIIIPTALPVSKWGEWLGKASFAASLIDRLEAASQVIELEGPSLRKKCRRK